MKIDKAIERLTKLKESGETHIIMAWWEREDVCSNTGKEYTPEEWKTESNFIEDKIDWSDINEQIDTIVGWEP